MSGIKTPEEIAEQEKRKIAMEKQRQKEIEEDKKNAEELKRILRKTEEIREKQPELYASIEAMARE